MFFFVASLENALSYSKHLSDVDNTDNENFLMQQKAEKRKHPVKYLEKDFDLSSKIKVK